MLLLSPVTIRNGILSWHASDPLFHLLPRANWQPLESDITLDAQETESDSLLDFSRVSLGGFSHNPKYLVTISHQCEFSGQSLRLPSCFVRSSVGASSFNDKSPDVSLSHSHSCQP